MKTLHLILNDLFKTAFLTWLILFLMEIFNAGMVNRFVSLEYYFYGLIFVYILEKVTDK